MKAENFLRTVRSVLLIDWPDLDVPETLARAGLRVVVRGGPGPEDFSSYEWKDGQIVVRRIGHPPERADLVYAYRPLTELPEIVGAARALQSQAVWTQSGRSAAGTKDPKGCWLPEEELRAAQTLVRSAGLLHISEPYIADAARSLISG